jgi:ABC-2 type transport system ATP-binding protein
MDALEVKGLSKSFGRFALSDVSFSIPMGSALGLVGENGAGKSTTIALILNLFPRDDGEVHVLGCDNTGRDFIACREYVGTVFDEACFPDGINAAQVERICRSIYKNWDSDAYFARLERYELPKDLSFGKFSRGMKMKLSLAVALSHQAKLLLLDEATGGLDPIARDELLEELKDFIADGEHAILLSSHIVSDIEKLCDMVAFLHRGRLLFCKKKETLLAEHPGLNVEEAILQIEREARGK